MSANNMPVLVVDDYSTMVRIIRKLLKTIGFENVDEAASGQAALEKIKAKQYGLIISDWNMEPMTGYELLKVVRADPAMAKTPSSSVTAESKQDNINAAKTAGVSGYIIKPFNEKVLKEKIDAALAAPLLPPKGRCLKGQCRAGYRLTVNIVQPSTCAIDVRDRNSSSPGGSTVR